MSLEFDLSIVVGGNMRKGSFEVANRDLWLSEIYILSIYIYLEFRNLIRRNYVLYLKYFK